MIELQRRLPNARIMYVSATGASEAENLCYMERLGLWGPGAAFPNKTGEERLLSTELLCPAASRMQKQLACAETPPALCAAASDQNLSIVNLKGGYLILTTTSLCSAL